MLLRSIADGADHSRRRSVRPTNDVSAPFDVRVFAVLAPETVFRFPLIATLLENGEESTSHALGVVGMDETCNPFGRRLNLSLAVSKQARHTFTPLELIRADVPVVDRVVRRTSRESIALLASRQSLLTLCQCIVGSLDLPQL